MKCIPDCGYDQGPNNGPTLANHMRDCDLNGPLNRVAAPVVVWRDGGFAVVEKADEDEKVYDIGFERFSHKIELPILDVDLVDGINVEPVTEVLLKTSEEAIE